MVGTKMFTFFAFCFVAGTLLSGIMEGETAFAVTTLTANVTASDNVIMVANTFDFLDLDDVYVESEVIRYTSKNGTTLLGVTRGLSSTEAVAHEAGSKVMNESSNVINNLLGYNVATTAATYGTVSAIVGLGWNLLRAIPRMISWDYSYLGGQLAMIKYLILWPISTGLVFSLGMMFITAIQGIFRR